MAGAASRLKMVAALGEQTVHQHGVDAFRGEHRLGDALGRVLIVIQPGGSEREIEIGDDRGHLGHGRQAPRQIMSDCRGSDFTLGADDGDHPPKRLGARHVEQLGHRLDEVDDAKRGHQIFADSAKNELPIENDVVELAKNDNLRSGVTILGQLLELLEERLPAYGSLEDDHVRRRRALISFNRSRRAAHVQLHMRLGHSAIGNRRADDGGDVWRFSQNTWIDTRGTGSICTAGRSTGAPPSSVPLPA